MSARRLRPRVATATLGLALAVLATACTSGSAGTSDLGTRPEGTVASVTPSTTRCSTDEVAASMLAGPASSRPTQLEAMSARDAIRATTVFGFVGVAVEAAALGEALDATPDLTILVPTDCAVATAQGTFDAWLADPRGALRQAMSHHVIAGGRFDLQQLAEQGVVTTLSGEDLGFTVDDGGRLRIDGAGTVVLADLQTSNATIHVIDTLLVPPSLRSAPDGA